MRLKSYAATAGLAAMALGIWMSPAILSGQPLYDRIHVELPYKVTLGDKTLQPGTYTIQQLPDTGGASRVLLFYTDNGMKFETSAMTIPALDPNTARDTKLILGRVGDDYYINKIWVQGKDYGYELPIPASLKDRQNERSETTVAAQYQPSNTSTATTSTTTTQSTATTAQATPPAATTTPEQSTPQATPPPVTSQTDTSLSAQNQQPTTQPAQTSPAAPSSADRAMPDTTPAPQDTTPAPTRMPDTSANWLMMLLGGGTLSGASLMLRRKR
jgi:hypothetical protein